MTNAWLATAYTHPDKVGKTIIEGTANMAVQSKATKKGVSVEGLRSGIGLVNNKGKRKMSYFKALCLAGFLALTGCGGGGGNPGTCNGGPDVCGRSTGTGSATTVPTATFNCSNAVLNAGDLCTVYSVSGSAAQAALTYTAGGETLQEKVTLPWSKEMLISKDTFLYISAQNQQNTGAVSVFINVNGRLLDSNRSTEAFGIATASGTFPPVAVTVDTPLVTSLKCVDMRSLSQALAYLAAGSTQLDENKNGKPCEDKFPGQ